MDADLDVDSVEFAPSVESSPEGAKGPDPDSVTTLVIALTGSPVLVRPGRVIQDWINRDKRTILLVRGDRKLEIHGPITDQTRELTEAFFRQETD